MIEHKVQLPQFEELKKQDDSAISKEEKANASSSTSNSSSLSKQASTGNSSISTAKVVSAKEKVGSNPLDLLNIFKNTTAEHGQHLFDLHCDICTNQTKEDLSLVHKPKPLSTFEKNLLLEEAEQIERRTKAAELINTEKLLLLNDGSPTSHLPSSSLDNFEMEHHQTTSIQQTKTIHSCWNGYINMQEVSRFIAFAYKVSGVFETQVCVSF